MPETATTTCLAGRRFLVVEDEFLVANQIAKTLRASGGKVIGAASSVRKALAFILQDPELDGAVIDINLAGEMAYPIVDVLNARGTPFVFASAYDRSHIPDRYRGARHCAKPLQAPDLIREMREALGCPEPAAVPAAPPANENAEPAAADAAPAPVLEAASPPPTNRLFDELSASALFKVRSRGSISPLIRGTTLRLPDIAGSEVYFPLSGVISVTRTSRSGGIYECRLIGREGALGLRTALGYSRLQDTATVLTTGQALTLPVSDFRNILAEEPTLAEMVRRYQARLIDELEQRVVCNATHRTPQRLAAWLLRCRARSGGDVIKVTQEQMSSALGVQRTTVTAAANQLRDDGILHYQRGRIRIADWRKLQAQACVCHRDSDTLNALLG